MYFFRPATRLLFAVMAVPLMVFSVFSNVSSAQDDSVVGPSGTREGVSSLAAEPLITARAQAFGRVGGVDVPLGGRNEPAIAINPLNSNNIAVGRLFAIRVSTDGGATFSAPTSAPVPAGFGRAGDPSVAFDSQGRLFWTYLGIRNDNGNFDVFISQVNPTTGAILAGYPVNVTAGAGFPASGAVNSNDKEWLAVDRFVGSPFQDRLYVVWTRFTGAGTVVHTTFSTNQGQNWSPALTLSAGGEGFVWPTHNAVAPNGDVYVSYHSQPVFTAGAPDGTSGQVFVLRSIDGGATFPQKTLAYTPGNADITFNVQTSARTLNQSASWTQGSGQAWVLPDALNPNNVYVVASDDPTNTSHGAGFDDMDVFIVRSTNQGLNWSAPTQVNTGSVGTTQFFPTAGIDGVTGEIAITWYDTRAGLTNAGGNFLLDLFLTTSNDGGLTFNPEIQINDVAFDPDFGAGSRFAGPPPTLRIGEYNGVAIANGQVCAVWTGNTTTGQQILFDCLLNLPPVANAGPDQTVECTSPSGASVTLDGSGSSDIDGDPLIYTWREGATIIAGPTNSPTSTVTLSLGTHTIELTVDDGKGGTDTDEVVVTVEDTTPPVITLLGDNPQVIECPADYVEFGATASDVCDGDLTGSITIDASAVDTSTPGTYTVTYNVTDAAGNTSEKKRAINVVDTTPPIITVAAPLSLWPPNHKYETIDITQCVVSVDDACAGMIPVSHVVITSVSSDELEDALGNGDGKTTDDILVADDCQSAQLRREREGGGNGRVYTIALAVDDGNGNVGIAQCQVTVPHDQDSDSALDDAPVYTVVCPPPAAPSIASKSPMRAENLSVLAVEGTVLAEFGNSGFDPTVTKDALIFIVVTNQSTGAVTKISSGLNNGTSQTFRLSFDLANRRAVRTGDLLRVTAQTSSLRIGIQPVSHIVSAEEINARQIHLPDLVIYEIPAQTQLRHNYPNPFNPETWIPYRLAEDANVTLTIYDRAGKVVRVIPVGHKLAAVYESKDKAVYWDGRNDFGERVASGVYFYNLIANDFSATRKMLILK